MGDYIKFFSAIKKLFNWTPFWVQFNFDLHGLNKIEIDWMCKIFNFWIELVNTYLTCLIAPYSHAFDNIEP